MAGTTSQPDAARADPAWLLRLGEQFLPLLLSNMQDIIHVLDDRGLIRYITPSVEQILGYAPEELVGQPAGAIVHPDDVSVADAAFEYALQHPGSTRRLELRLRHADGSWRVIEMYGRSYVEASGVPGAIVTTRDITELRGVEGERRDLLELERAAREAAEAAERRAAFLADVSSVLDASLDYHLTLTNLARLLVPQLADYCLIDEVEDDGGTRRVAIAHIDPQKEKFLLRNDRNPPDADPDQRPVVKVVRTRESRLVPEVTEAVLRALARTPERRRILERLALRSFMMVPLIARDRTLGAITLVSAESGRRYGPADLELAEEVARRAALSVDNARLYGRSQQATRAREEVLAVVSHDLRNPLATILLNSSAMIETGKDRFSRGELDQLEWIARSSEKMNNLIEDLLEIARAESGHLTLHRRALEADDLIADARAVLELPAQQKQLHLILESVSPVGRVLADRERVLQVFANLIGNAIKFTPPGGSIALIAAGAPGAVQFSVRDSGAGIAQNDLSHIFDRYWQARRTARGGTGLGLAIARGLVEAHGGQIWAESTVGAGSTFHFTLPSIE